jgi:hypothetical protein
MLGNMTLKQISFLFSIKKYLTMNTKNIDLTTRLTLLVWTSSYVLFNAMKRSKNKGEH